MGSVHGATCAERTTDRQAHRRAAAVARNRLGDNRRNRSSARNRTNWRARSAARRILILRRPSGRRSCVNVNPELRSRASVSRSSAVSFFTRRRSSRTSCWSSGRHVQADHHLRCLAEPPTGRRARDPEIRGGGQVPGALDEIPKGKGTTSRLLAVIDGVDSEAQLVGARLSGEMG
jgi:hypothetical protein